MYTVYVLYSKQYDKIYIGYTSDLEGRLKSHNELSTKGWTIKFVLEGVEEKIPPAIIMHNAETELLAKWLKEITIKNILNPY